MPVSVLARSSSTIGQIMKLYRKLRQHVEDAFGCTPQQARNWSLVIGLACLLVIGGLVWLWTYLIPLGTTWDLVALAVIAAGSLAALRQGRRGKPTSDPVANEIATVENRSISDDGPPTIEFNTLLDSEEKFEPPAYSQLKHWKSFAKDAAIWVVAACGGLVIVGLAVAATIKWPRYDDVTKYVVLAAILFVVVALFMIGRAHAAWKLRPISCDARDGRLLVHQTGSRLWVLFGSPPDTYPLDEISLTTPPQTVWETYFFRTSNTIALEGENGKTVELRDIVNVEALIEIQKYRDELTRDQVRLAEQSLAENKRTNQLLEQLLAHRNQQS
ncbi:MAG TPA: hypothetical protein VFK03_00160 [Candidatus Saccharimonadales bacterium]|nr:hypothetical protein [Candidatus Saccharimonadales bacterium]